jgi:putative colanic acid biosynthesis acetyltransferase WcaF
LVRVLHAFSASAPDTISISSFVIDAWRARLRSRVYSLIISSALRVALLRMFGARIGSGVVVRANVNVSYPWRLTLGDDVWLGEEVMILSLAPVVIESSVCISQRAFLCTGSHDFRSEKFSLVTKPITVRGGSWIAAQAFISPGVDIGEGSMVCAGSVVVENVPPKCIVRGNPAQVVKQLA